MSAMIVKHLKQNDYAVSSWSGGRTIQLAIAPEGAVYADRDFLWRLSSATVELDESDFTALPDYERLIAPLNGEMILSHNGGPEIRLLPCQVHAFDGADRTHSRGRCTDFNLMLRKARCEGQIGALLPCAGTEQSRFVPDPRAESLLFYCTEGSVKIGIGESAHVLQEGESLLLETGSAAEQSKKENTAAGKSKDEKAGKDRLPAAEIAHLPGGRLMAAQMWTLPELNARVRLDAARPEDVY